MSPEICASERYTLLSDIWALGCIMYELCTTKVPFNAATHIQLVQKINMGKIDPIPAQYSQELNDVIRSCLKTNPKHRPDTAMLINHGKVRLAREKREVVELGKRLEKDEKHLALKLQEFSLKDANWEAEKEQLNARLRAEISAEVEESKRREWEVKARLEISRQVQIEMANLQARFEAEVQTRVEAEMQKRTKEVNSSRPLSSPSTQPSSFAQDIGEDIPSTNDISNLSVDSPIEEQPSPLQLKRITPPKRKPRGPLARSRTQFDSPMDVTMGEPSPVSIANLNLSPRRTATADLPSIHNSKNIFAAAAAQKSRHITQLPTPPSVDQSTIEEDDEYEDSLPELPSPTRVPIASSDPFKKPTRPGLLRQKTAPIGRVPTQPSLFPTARAPRGPSPPMATRSNLASTGSPSRKQPDDMFRKVMARNLQGVSKPLAESDPPTDPVPGSNENLLMKKVMHRNLRGQTLVELAQPRAGGNADGAMAKGTSGGENNWRPKQDVVVWDPEVDEMPSPFLPRARKKI